MMDGGMDAGPPDMGSLCRTVCEGATPVCDLESLACVGCVDDRDCPDGLCELGSQTCVECIDTADCAAHGGGVCNPVDNTCVECTTDLECDAAAPRCTPDHTCVECLTTTDCDTGLCLEAENRCVECLATTDCTSASSSRCAAETNSCAACSSHADCGHIGGLPSCLAGTCVACTPATEATACGMFSCNRTTNTCTTTTRASLDDYQQCQATSECQAGSVCVTQNLVGPDFAVCVPVLTEANCLEHLPLLEQQERLTVEATLVTVCALRTNWLTLAAAQLLIEYQRAPAPRATAASYECVQNNECPAGSFCRDMIIAGSVVNRACTLAGCTSSLECPANMSCNAFVSGGTAYCAFWDN
jgi:hypothetical protein